MLGKLLGRGHRSSAVAVDAAVVSAEFADQDQSLLERLSGAVYADCGVAGRNASLLRESIQTGSGVVTFAKNLTVGGLQNGKYLMDALTLDLL
jgi:hypothetical protein